MIRRILIVDDDPLAAEIFQKVVRSIDAAIEVTIAMDGAKALESVPKGKPDMIFLDSMMPVMDGIECLTKLKANRNTKKIPVVLYTSSEDKTEHALALRLGAFHLIRKSGNIEKLTGEIRQMISLAEVQ
jgi:CheY-like chemotaxis protein